MPNVRRRQQTIETVTILYNGKLRLERRNTNPTIHARAFQHGKTVGKSTGETTLGAATKVATGWYLDQLDRLRKGDLRGPVPLFTDVAKSSCSMWNNKRKCLPVSGNSTGLNGTC